MRLIGLSLFVILMISAIPLWAQPSPFQSGSESREDTLIDLTAASKNRSLIRLRTGKSSQTLQAGAGLTFKSLSQGLGTISALAMAANGTLYVADSSSGRIWRLPDRNQDGRFDSKQALPQRFDTPSGLAVHEQTVYVADRNAIWSIEGVHPPVKLAGLLKAKSKGQHHPLTISADRKTLFLGLTTKQGKVRVLGVDIQTGAARLLQERQSDQDIIALGALGSGTPWVALDHAVGPSLTQVFDLDSSHTLASLALPIGTSEWPSALSTHVIVSRLSPDGYDVIAIPAGLGQIEGKGRIIFSGFLNASRRAAWGVPGALYFDENGLIVADSKNGDLYRLSADPVKSSEVSKAISPPSNSQTLESDPLETTIESPKMRISTIEEGSQIGSVSTLKRGSSLEVGSTIIQDYKPLSLNEDEVNTSKSVNGGDFTPQRENTEK